MPIVAAPAPLIFDYKDPKEISAVALAIDSPLEPIVGWAKGISGKLSFDPARAELTTGTISVDVDSVTFAHEGYTATARGYALNGKTWPRLTLAITKVESVRKTSPTRYEGVVLADFTCRGITQSKRLNVTADYLPGRAEERTNGQRKGDLLVLRTEFSVSRKAHGISEGIPDDLVGDAIGVRVAVVGIHYADAAKDGKAPASEAPASPERAGTTEAPTGSPLDRVLPRIGEGAPMSLRQAAGPAGTIVFFLNEQCGVTVYYKDRLRKLVREFGDALLGEKRFGIVAVRTGRKQFADRPVELPERAYLPIPFLDDADGALMDRYGVAQSMTFAVLDAGGEVRYFGGFDDHVQEASVTKSPLRAALLDLHAGRPVREPRFTMLGCAILPVAR